VSLPTGDQSSQCRQRAADRCHPESARARYGAAMKSVPETGVCPNCGFGSAFVQAHQVQVWPSAKMNPDWADGESREVLTVMRCLHCSKTATYLAQQNRHPRNEASGRTPVSTFARLVHPAQSPRTLSEHVPEPVRSLFREASVSEAVGAARGAAGLYRAAVERLCDDQGIAPGVLYKRLEALKEKAIDDQVVADLHEARLLGNFSLHDGVEFSAEEIADVADLIVEATTSLYVQPAERRRLRDARKQRRENP
jgi:hypothetical protein